MTKRKNLWNFTNKFNSESVLEVSHSAQGSYWGIWGGNSDEGNTINVMVGPRNYVRLSSPAPELPSGWSFNVFTQNFVDFMGSDLTEVLFDNCNLRRTVFIDTILNKADFYTSYDYTLDLEKNKAKKAIFSTDGLKGLLEKYDIIVK